MTLPPELQKKWTQAEQTGLPVFVGRLVACDYCEADFTDSDRSGGFIFESKAVCPKCAPAFLESVKKFNELRFIRATCPSNQSFADFVREWRGPDANIHITNI